MARGPIRRSARGDYIVELDDGTRSLVRHMCDQVDGLLDSDSPLLARLFPPPYGDDTERNEGYAALAGPELIENRRAALDSVRRTADAERVTEEELLDWMRSLNDMRLVLGTLLGVEDDGEPELAEEHSGSWDVYEHLGMLLEIVVDAMSS